MPNASNAKSGEELSCVIDTHDRVQATATVDAVRNLRSRAAAIARAAGADEQTVRDVRLAINEALANVHAHAYEGREGPVEMDIVSTDDELTVVVRDHGVGVEHSSSSEGGRCGLVIIERLAVRSSVSSTPGRGTEVTMVFRITQADRA